MLGGLGLVGGEVVLQAGQLVEGVGQVELIEEARLAT